jgi:ADP-heptose:LPS heptosyltransferase
MYYWSSARFLLLVLLLGVWSNSGYNGNVSEFPRFSLPKDPVNQRVNRCRLTFERADKRILIQRNGAHGDILMATPFLTALREAMPHAHITWIVEQTQSGAIDAHPCIDELLLWNTPYWKQMLRRGLYPFYLWKAQKLRRLFALRRYDIFISFQPEEWGYLVAEGCGAETRIGVFDTFAQFSRKSDTRNSRRYTRSFTQTDLPAHRTDQYLLPLKALGLALPENKQMSMGFTVTDEGAVRRWLTEQGLGEQPFVIFAPMTTWLSRNWSTQNFAHLGDMLRAEGIPVVLIGSSAEQLEVEAIADQMKYRPLLAAGQFAFREMAALLSHASVLVSGDTGPMHVASAVGTPFVALFGPTPIEGRAPLAGKGRVIHHPLPCAPCDQKVCPLTGDDYMLCMRRITVNEVAEAVREWFYHPENSRTGAASG